VPVIIPTSDIVADNDSLVSMCISYKSYQVYQLYVMKKFSDC